jgi:hypothetical protein
MTRSDKSYRMPWRLDKEFNLDLITINMLKFSLDQREGSSMTPTSKKKLNLLE